MFKMIRMIAKTMKVLLVFTVCTLFFYYGILWISKEYESYEYDEGYERNAMEVSNIIARPSSAPFIERLLLFYKEGE